MSGSAWPPKRCIQALIDAEATAVIGAGPWAHSEDRVAVRNGTRPRGLTTTAGDLELRIPKLRTGTFFPSLLERQRRIDQALFAVVEALSAACTRKSTLVQPSADGISKSDADLRGPRLRGGRVPGPFPGRHHVSVRVPGRHLLQGPVNHRVVS